MNVSPDLSRSYHLNSSDFVEIWERHEEGKGELAGQIHGLVHLDSSMGLHSRAVSTPSVRLGFVRDSNL